MLIKFAHGVAKSNDKLNYFMFKNNGTIQFEQTTLINK